MPVYLCQSGAGFAEPWRHGIQVYAAPFPIQSPMAATGGRDLVMLQPGSNPDVSNWETSGVSAGGGGGAAMVAAGGGDGQPVPRHSQSTRTPALQQESASRLSGMPIRRVRHAEIVLADDVCTAYGRYWLRLCWPGHTGGFAGYIAMGLVTDPNATKWVEQNAAAAGERPTEISFSAEGSEQPQEGIAHESNNNDDAGDEFFPSKPPTTSSVQESRIGAEDADHDDPARDDEPQDAGSAPLSEPFDSTGTETLTCLRTGLDFPSSLAMKLMIHYDDGMTPTVASAPFPTEPVFCRICREGLHDDADEQQPSPAVEDGTDGATPAGNANTQRMESSNTLDGDEDDPDATGTGPAAEDAQVRGSVSEPVAVEPNPMKYPKGPVQPHPTYHPNPHAAENPLLAPCECSGSMAFVHYLCVEQWRCRSRHPDAHHGLQCETCGGAYTLPPPSARHANVPPVDNEDWLDAMPPHVMAALRQPHIGWQIGAAIVRRRWLRPVAPVVMSPLVALYCRARRMLKKRGVARRRWACSLCRRRARWKCVRCLRSYYCSRQCQNVSWHIVHKHVCYKPARFWWSVVVYGIATIVAFPGVLRDPLMYDFGLCTIPVSFIVMALLGGGLATFLKKSMGMDLRGRMFEFVVVVFTLWLVLISWGVVRGLFGDVSQCYGATGPKSVYEGDLHSYTALNYLRRIVLRPAQTYYRFWDGLFWSFGPWVRKIVCTKHMDEEGLKPREGVCFQHLPNVKADFFLAEHGGERCASDLLLVVRLYIAAGFALVGSTLWKRRERQRRLAARGRPHQD